jgi:hypothetical protein
MFTCVDPEPILVTKMRVLFPGISMRVTSAISMKMSWRELDLPTLIYLLSSDP